MGNVWKGHHRFIQSDTVCKAMVVHKRLYVDLPKSPLHGVHQMKTEKWFFISCKDEKKSAYKMSQLHKAKTCWTENLLT